MTGYRRHGPRFTWTNWWGRMLIRTEEDDAEVLAAEDEAIAEAEAGPEVTPDDLAGLVEILNDGPTPQVQPESRG